MKVVFNEVGPQHAAQVAQLHSACVKVDYEDLLPDCYINQPVSSGRISAWKGWLQRSKVDSVAAWIENQLVGFATLQPDYTDSDSRFNGDLVGIYVLESYWSCGIGRALFERMKSSARARGFSQLNLWELDGNRQGRSYYESLGFSASEKRRVFLEEADLTLYEVKHSIRLSG